MNTSILLHQELLARGRQMFDLGFLSEAGQTLRPLVKQPNIPANTLCEAHRLLGEIEHEAGNFARARKHFAIAIGLVSDEASLYTLYARSVDADPEGDPAKALKARRRATHLDIRNASMWSSLGWSYLRTGNRDRARKAFRRALCLKSESIDTLGEVIEGLISLNRLLEAQQAIRTARFRFPNDVAGLKCMADRVQFEILRREQRLRLDATEGTSILKFVPRPSEVKLLDVNPVVIRADRRSLPTPHLFKFLGRRSGPKRAN